MLTEILLLIIFGFIFIWSTAWIRYFNNLDERLGNSIWRWSYDYPVKGKRDISNLDDKEFVLLRRKRNKAVTLMWWIFFILFILLIISPESDESISISIELISANLLNKTALPSITGLDASAPRLPIPKIAEPLLITATKLPLLV